MPEKKKQASKAFYAKYMGLAFQIFFILFIGWWLGNQLDKYFNFDKPYLGLALTFLFLIGFFVKLYRDVQSGNL